MRQFTPFLASLLSSVLALAGCGSPERDRGGNNGGSGTDLNEIILSNGASASEPRFSPDGTTIAFIQTLPNDVIDVVRMDTTGGQQMTLAPASIYLAAPAWTPDGKQVYFASNVGISVVAASGGAASMAVDDFATMDPDISPDGKSIVYAINGSNLKLVELANPTMIKDLGHSGMSPRFSPDGLSIAFQGGNMIRVMTLATGDTKDIVDAGWFFASVDWFPDGTRLAITSDKGIEIVTLGATPTRSMVREEFASMDIDVSADGTALAYDINGQKSIYTLTGF